MPALKPPAPPCCRFAFAMITTLFFLRSSLIDSAVFIACFAMALPAGFLIRRIGYENTIVTGLVLFALGAFLFRTWPRPATGGRAAAAARDAGRHHRQHPARRYLQGRIRCNSISPGRVPPFADGFIEPHGRAARGRRLRPPGPGLVTRSRCA